MAALSARMPPPMSLQTGSAPKKVWEDWIQQFEFYELVVELSKKDDNVQTVSSRNAIVIGVYSDSDRGHLLSVDDLTLDAAVKFCRAAEQSRSHLSSLKADPVQVDLVRPRRSQAAVNEPADKCQTGLVEVWHKAAWKKCPAFEKICHGCKEDWSFSTVL
ncbi:hypothetical protein JTE90_022182 [Oedothorax gibbosus]|uniref:Uncharacterized protein n=1 Tax=Oedothorax gibbosus TaxID=931172 RepID=A0AAV6VPN4_9ARAC|nr:hypothetical protein JTE90_022182 [Oedothorax gibbosus]